MRKWNSVSYLCLLIKFCLAQTDVISTDSIRLEGLENGVGNSGTLISSGTMDNSAVEKKLVFWIHGLAGNQHSWNLVQAVTEDQTGTAVAGYPVRHTEGLALSYEGYENLDIFSLAGFVNNSKMEIWRTAIPRRDTINVDSNFVIAHSQGGMVSRAIRFQNLQDPSSYHKQFNALATFGTPHKGAAIINSTRNGGEVQKWINRGCEAIAPAEIQTFINTKWWLDAIISTNTVNAFSSKACNGLNKIALPILVNSIRKPVGKDYAIGARNLAQLDSLAQLDTTFKVVCFYGIESEPVLWRTIHTMTYTKDSSLAGHILSNNPFGLNDDQELPDLVNQQISSYNAKWAFHNANSNHLWYQAVLQDDNEKAKAEKYRRAYLWLLTANTAWKRFIGARRDTSFIDGYQCDCLIDLGGLQGYSFSSTIVQNTNDCNAGNALSCNASPRIRHEIIEEPNDGVVPISSQKGYPRAIRIPMLHTNHMQERNNNKTKDRLNELFDGDYGVKFRLKKK